MPCLHDKLIEAAASFLRPHWPALTCGLLEDRVELIDLLIGELGVINLFMVVFLNNPEAARLRCESLTEVLYGPGFTLASGAPEELGGFVGASMFKSASVKARSKLMRSFDVPDGLPD